MGVCEVMSLSNIILNEVNVGRPVLYHFTNQLSAIRILESNVIATGEESVVSLTRNPSVRIAGKAKFDYNFRFTLDWNRLKDFYTIKPFRYSENLDFKSLPRDVKSQEDIDKLKPLQLNKTRYGDEWEERIDKSITQLHRFIIQIDINATYVPLYRHEIVHNQLLKAMEKNGKMSHVNIEFIYKWEPVKI